MSKKDKKPTNKAKPPSIFKMAANFAKDLTKYVKEGAPNVTHKQYVDRLEACKKCPHLIEPTMRCGKCGCLLEYKAKWRTTTCPDTPQRWEPLYLSPEDLVKMETAKNINEKEYKEDLVEYKKTTDVDYNNKIREWNKKIQKAYEEGKFRPQEYASREDVKFVEEKQDRPRKGFPFESITKEEADTVNRRREEESRKTNNSNSKKGKKNN